MEEQKSCYLVLEDGHVFAGKRFGAERNTMGELVFTTGMIDHVETMTDPCYYGQIVMQTFPQIGNYGMITQDCANKNSFLKGYVVREWCEEPSNFRCEGTIDAYLKAQDIPGICGVDTREITQLLREHGIMNAAITDDPAAVSKELLKAYCVTNAVQSVSSMTPPFAPTNSDGIHVALIHYGASCHLVEALNSLGCVVTIFPHTATAEEILASAPRGVLLSSGPGDPKENLFAVAQIQKLIGKLPLFAIGLGHQLLALAKGGETTELSHGHRGANQPVKRLRDGRTFVTLQNHGYMVLAESVTNCGGVISYENTNDRTCEGVEYPADDAFSVQFCPYGCGGTKDTAYLLEQFVALMGGKSLCR